MLAKALSMVGLEAIVVGNVASILNGAPVLTQDVDLLVRDTPLNAKKLKKLAALMGGVGPVEISGLTRVKRIEGSEYPIDFLFDELGARLRFAAIRSRSFKEAVGAYTLTVASLEDVIKSKQAANRPKDRAVMPILLDTLATKKALEGG